MKLLSVVIIYHPEIELLRNNVKLFFEDVDKLIIWDNTPGGTDNLREIFAFFEVRCPGKIEYMGDGANHCIAYPLNRVVEYAFSNGYTHLLTMDQDSLFGDNSFSKYIRIIENQQKEQAIAMFGVNFNYQFKICDLLYPVECVITSGTIYVLSALKVLGPFREDYGIDCVDSEMCLRAREQGFVVMMAGNIVLKQQIGDSVQKSLGYSLDNYSAFRVYHIVRNNIRMWREYPKLYNTKFCFIRYAIVTRIPKIIFHEEDKFLKFKALFWGIIDGLSNKSGMRDI